MNVNCVNIEKEEETLNVTNINLLVTFNKKQAIYIYIYICIYIFYNSVYTKLKTNVKKHTAVPRRQYTLCLEEKLKCKNP